MRIGITTILTTSDGSDTKLKFAGFLECGRGTSLLWPNRIQPIFTQKNPKNLGTTRPITTDNWVYKKGEKAISVKS